MKFFNLSLKSSSHTSDDPSRLSIKPYRDWRIIFSVFFALLIVSIGIHVYVFSRVEAGTIFQAPEAEVISENTLNVGLLNQVIDRFDQKATRLNAIVGSSATIIQTAQ
jgi:hypothetical protein